MAVALLLFLARLATVSDIRSTREQIVKETPNVSRMQSHAAKVAFVSSWPQDPPLGKLYPRLGAKVGPESNLKLLEQLL